MPYHILLVDDDHHFRNEFKEFMEDFDVIEASNGQEALKILKKPHNIDLVILDEHMPEIKGTELLEHVHKISPNTRTVILTGQSSKEVAIGAVRGHATDYIEKPLSDNKVEKIKNLLLSSPHGERDKALSGVKGKIERAKYFAQRNYNKKLTLADVADEVCLSPKYLSRIFKEKTGMSFVDYRLSIRMDKAKEMLEKTGDNVEEISYKLGYQNPESFGKVFRQFTRRSPREYREYLQKKSEQKGHTKTIANTKKVRKTTAQAESNKDILHPRKCCQLLLDRFGSIFIHEMRRPLTSIQIAAWNIKKKAKDPSLEKNIACIEDMTAHTEQMINYLLNYTRIQEPSFKIVNIRKFLEKALNTTSKDFPKKDLKIKKYFGNLERKRIKIDPLLFEQLIGHIISNAYQAKRKNKPCKITIKSHVIHNRFLITINDNGYGIKKTELKNVFEPFFTLRTKTLGLGLSICKKIITLHNGDIKIESQHNRGTTVTIDLARSM